MKKLNIPSYSHLVPREHRIRAIQELYESINKQSAAIDEASPKFVGTYDTIDELKKVEADANDYAWVKGVDDKGNPVYNHYRYASDGWEFEYQNPSGGVSNAYTKEEVDQKIAKVNESSIDVFRLTGPRLSFIYDENDPTSALRIYDSLFISRGVDVGVSGFVLAAYGPITWYDSGRVFFYLNKEFIAYINANKSQITDFLDFPIIYTGETVTSLSAKYTLRQILEYTGDVIDITYADGKFLYFFNIVTGVVSPTTIRALFTEIYTTGDWNTATYGLSKYYANANWSETDSNLPSYILNKPTIPSKTSELTNDSNFATTTDLESYLKYSSNTVTVAGNSKELAKVSPEAVYFPNGIVMGGSAAAAGLVTRGITGVNTPDSNGDCSKDNLYVNYDGDNNYTHALVLGAGAPGAAITTTTGASTAPANKMGNIYAAVRGDQMVNYVTDKINGVNKTLEGKADLGNTSFELTHSSATYNNGKTTQDVFAKVGTSDSECVAGMVVMYGPSVNPGISVDGTFNVAGMHQFNNRNYLRLLPEQQEAPDGYQFSINDAKNDAKTMQTCTLPTTFTTLKSTTPANTDDSTNVATTEWVNGKLDSFVKISDEDTGETVNNAVSSIWKGTKAEYDAITNPSDSTLYIIVS